MYKVGDKVKGKDGFTINDVKYDIGWVIRTDIRNVVAIIVDYDYIDKDTYWMYENAYDEYTFVDSSELTLIEVHPLEKILIELGCNIDNDYRFTCEGFPIQYNNGRLWELDEDEYPNNKPSDYLAMGMINDYYKEGIDTISEYCMPAMTPLEMQLESARDLVAQLEARLNENSI